MSESFKVKGRMNFDVSILWLCMIPIGSSLGQMAETQEGLPDVVPEQPVTDVGKCLLFINPTCQPIKQLPSHRVTTQDLTLMLCNRRFMFLFHTLLLHCNSIFECLSSLIVPVVETDHHEGTKH